MFYRTFLNSNCKSFYRKELIELQENGFSIPIKPRCQYNKEIKPNRQTSRLDQAIPEKAALKSIAQQALEVKDNKIHL